MRVLEILTAGAVKSERGIPRASKILSDTEKAVRKQSCENTHEEAEWHQVMLEN
jgi:hypothetical protein